MEFLDSSGKIEEDTETSRRTYSGWTEAERENIEVPAGTRTIRVKMRAYRRSGSDNDCYFDDLSLTLYIPTDAWNGSWTGNKIENPGAEDGLNHWRLPRLTSVSSPYYADEPWAVIDSKSGSRFWSPDGEFIYAGAYQNVDVSDYAEAIDGGGVKAFLEGYLTSRYEDGDEARFRMEYLDLSGNILGSESTGYHDSKNWYFDSLEEYLPISTRTVRVIMETKEDYGHGAWLYGSFDDLSLTLALPELSKSVCEKSLECPCRLG